ncbi:cell division protein ZapE [Oleiagrimonas sp. C23AA]|uniref:cell division protein ZapE n=1 Tax=Oleiagrimonas sp. C23AA TaxID=2719047 RepID=UPI001423AF4D|nr:cell division protein ZapE [Oleiagrimonas sp. C23AA]NII11251.1 cell division protein ZapE [Oleiagrimonas sp. C23AA]
MTDPSADPQSPSARYAQGVQAHRWERDRAQLPALAELDRMHSALHQRAGRRQGMLGRLRQALGKEQSSPVQGLYLWGSVGRGKTFLMDLFVAGLPQGTALRRHFHRFMAEVHEALRQLGHRADPLPLVADDLASRARVLCLDEFIVQDIGDAMILGGLLDALFARGVSLVTTSNTEPENLYAGGLQRARFLPAIDLIETHCKVLMLDSRNDWRLRALEQAPVYQCPPGAEAERALSRIFNDYAEGDVHEGGQISVNDRHIAVRRHADNIAWFDFDALCDGPRAVADYIALGKRFPAIVVSNVPPFGPDNNDPAKRFIHLVDEFYDRHVKLVLSAAAPIVELYDGERHRAEFERTASRLIEMQSQDYLASEHLD